MTFHKVLELSEGLVASSENGSILVSTLQSCTKIIEIVQVKCLAQSMAHECSRHSS